MNEEVKSLIEFAQTMVEVLAIVLVSFAPTAPLVKLTLSAIPLTSMAARYFRNRLNKKGLDHVE